jgi:hypothetical protein
MASSTARYVRQVLGGGVAGDHPLRSPQPEGGAKQRCEQQQGGALEEWYRTPSGTQLSAGHIWRDHFGIEA